MEHTITRLTPRTGAEVRFAGADHGIHFWNILTNIVAESFHQATCDHQPPGAPRGLVLRHFQDRIDRFLLGAGDKRAGVDHDDVGVFGA